ncbi:hypothetical protein AUR64_06520 [Haloprofundus marisrubri]|uniref:Archaeal Type IV pilin N-terminal domain-containing protein n=1 Tax=Haloprofundus marisrubri TaxID=1514971 RepID=A0A0W1RBT3_9EURY|nr:type IV pilin N-terminal domain-containing protein [Haloprofundus marisrubri]KTG10838.1 hypothetical protein AUR64_06520 [Haloprofundus marisrubri]
MHPDSRAVSPVVGVTLLVTIVVLLAVTAGGIFLGIGVEEAAPQVATDTEIEAQYDTEGAIAEYVLVAHEAGATVSREEIRIVVTAGDERVVDPPLVSGTLGAGDELRYDVSGVSLCDTGADAAVVTLYHEPSNKPIAEHRIRIEYDASYTGGDDNRNRGTTLVCS